MFQNFSRKVGSMFDFFLRRKQKTIVRSDQPQTSNDNATKDYRCVRGNHEFDDPPHINWKACGAIVTSHKRHVKCQRPGCDYATIQTRERLTFEWNAPFGPWKDFKAGIDCE